MELMTVGKRFSRRKNGTNGLSSIQSTQRTRA